MRRKALPFSGALILGGLLNLSLVLAAAAQTPSTNNPILIAPAAAAGEPVQIDSLLERGRQLETEHRWGEALNLYEGAIKDFPAEPSLASRHDLAKIHYDLGRRYSDSSFLRMLPTLSQQQAVALYSEVLLKIQSHYVSEPNWQALVDRGLLDVQVALGEPSFARLLHGKSANQIAAFGDQLPRMLQGRTIRTRQEAADAVDQVARRAQQQLNLPAANVVMEFVCGATGALDEYSSYLTRDQLNDVYSQIEGNFVGLGIELKASDGALLIVKVIPASPAARGGIRPDDRITAVDGHSTKNLTTDQAADLLQGKEGSVCQISFTSPGGQTQQAAIRREHIEVPSVDQVKIIDRDNGVAYLKLTCFEKTTARDLDAALWDLNRQGMRSLIMDLRGNPGGLLTSSVEVADKFVEDGTIVSTRGRNALEDYNYTAHKVGTWRVPLVVLIDGDSASASEIFAGAIRDHHRGTIVGQRSYGKGSVQGIFPLTTGGCGVRLTTAKFFSPSGRAISHVGVSPDIVVQRTAKPVANGEPARAIEGEDPFLGAALQAARQQMAQR